MILCEISFAAITALATTIAAIIAFFSLKNEREKRKLSVFSESIRNTLDGVKNAESLDYIMSKKYNNDIATIKDYLGIDDVGLDDFKKIVIQNLKREDLDIDEETKNKIKEELRKGYNKIEHFCEKMEYLGIMAQDNIASDLIVGYFGDIIIDTYQRLEPLIVKTQNDRRKADLYPNYACLYQLVKEKTIK